MKSITFKQILFTCLIFVCIVILFKFYFKRNIDSLDNDNSYVREQNQGRDQFGVPPIEPDWVIHRRTNKSIYLTTPVRGLPGFSPTHLAKTILIEHKDTLSEKDEFHFQLNDFLGYRLVIRNEYLGEKKWRQAEIKFITYTFKEHSEVSSKIVETHYGDSVLREWNMVAKKNLFPRK